jgi:hypothetical protein
MMIQRSKATWRCSRCEGVIAIGDLHLTHQVPGTITFINVCVVCADVLARLHFEDVNHGASFLITTQSKEDCKYGTHPSERPLDEPNAAPPPADG